MDVISATCIKPMATDNPKPIDALADNPSPVEVYKDNSNYLRGGISNGLADDTTGAVREGDDALIKFHGIYQQDNRDQRADRARRKLEPDYSFMIRLRVPGGLLTAEQWLAVDEAATTLSESGSIRLTTRQTLQFHGVPKENLRPLLQTCAKRLLDSIAACGDVNRNVMSSSHPELSLTHAQAYQTAVDVSARLLPKSRAYYEIWLGEERVAGGEPPQSPQEAEPLYGKHYLPRKFKIGIAVPPQNDVDIYSQDIGFIAIARGDKLAGYNVVAGGGLSLTHNDSRTYPRLGSDVGFCKPKQAADVAWHIAAWQRDFGDRSDRKQARLKYTIDRRGVDTFRTELQQRLGYTLDKPKKVAWESRADRLGWHKRRDGCYDFGIFVENGRINEGALKDALRAVARLNLCRFLMTPNQNILLIGVAAAKRTRLNTVMKKHGIAADGIGVGVLRRNAMACVALPTCPLAMAESERYLPSLLIKLEEKMTALGMADDDIEIRMTGCPNGCARPYLGEVGLVGKAPGRYNLFLGASHTGDRLSSLAGENMDEEMIITALTPLFESYAKKRKDGERFGDFLVRNGDVRTPTEAGHFHEVR